jgi:hypothetical protein
MKKILVTAVLGFAVVAAGQVAQPAQQPQGQPARASTTWRFTVASACN